MTRDWHAERYAAGEALAKAARETLAEIQQTTFPLTRITALELKHAPQLTAALVEYERTRDAP